MQCLMQPNAKIHPSPTWFSWPRYYYADSWQAYKHQCPEHSCSIDWEREHAGEKGSVTGEMSLLWKPKDLDAVADTGHYFSLLYSSDSSFSSFSLYIYVIDTANIYILSVWSLPSSLPMTHLPKLGERRVVSIKTMANTSNNITLKHVRYRIFGIRVYSLIRAKWIDAHEYRENIKLYIFKNLCTIK